jgi:hypothetical protein
MFVSLVSSCPETLLTVQESCLQTLKMAAFWDAAKLLEIYERFGSVITLPS